MISDTAFPKHVFSSSQEWHDMQIKMRVEIMICLKPNEEHVLAASSLFLYIEII